MTQPEKEIVFYLTRLRDGVGTATDNWQAVIDILNLRGDVI